jgi:hypothetical protein
MTDRTPGVLGEVAAERDQQRPEIRRTDGAAVMSESVLAGRPGRGRWTDVQHAIEYSAVEDPYGIGLATAEWRCSCGEGSPHPVTPPTAKRWARAHLDSQGG